MTDVDLTRRQKGAMMPAKLWMASLYGCLGFLLPYFNLILAHFGYNGWQIGVISAIRPLTAALCGPLWAGFADLYTQHRAVLVSCLVLSSAARATLGILAHPFWYLIAMVLVIECLASPIPALSDAAVMSAASTDGCYGSCRMWACLTWNTAGIISSLVMRFSDDSSVFAIYAASSSLAVISACYLDMSLIPSRQTISTTPEPVACHSQAAAEPEASSLTGRLYDHEHESSDSEAHAPLLSTCTRSPEPPEAATQAGSTAPDANVVLNDADTNHFSDTTGPGLLEEDALTRSTPYDLHAAGVHHTSPVSSRLPEKLATLLRDRRVIVFLARAMLMGMFVTSQFEHAFALAVATLSLLERMEVCIGAIDGYLFVYLDSLGAPPLLLGSCLAVVCSAEIPVFAYSGHILRALGYHGALQAALAAYCMRLLAYSCLPLVPSLWMVLPVELLHGVTFGVAWCAGVNHSKRVAPAGLESTVQSLFSGAYSGVGKGMGGLCAGIIYHWYGGQVLFWSFFVGVVTVWGAITALERVPRQ